MAAQVIINADGFTNAEYQDVKQCLETLLAIPAGTQPLDRDFGIDTSKIISQPMYVAENTLSLEIIEKVKKYEPRVKVESITFQNGEDGQLIPTVHFMKAED